MMKSKILRTLYQKGLIIREEDKIDTRSKNIYIKEKVKYLVKQTVNV